MVRHYGFEPNPIDFAKLQSSATAKFFQLAISDAPGKAKFHAHPGSGSLSERVDRAGMSETYNVIDVTVETLENLAAQNDIPQPDVIKTDAELYDLRAVRGAGSLLDNVLCVTCEFEYAHWAQNDNSFSSIDLMLNKRGMILFGLSHRTGPIGEISGGDLLYLRDVGSIVSSSAPDQTKRSQLLKLFAICGILKQPKYLVVVAEVGKKAGLLNEAEFRELRGYVSENVFVPWSMPGGAEDLRGRLTHMLCLLGEFLTGRNCGVKSAPRSNQFPAYTHAFMNKRWLPAGFLRRYEVLLDLWIRVYEGNQGIYYRATSPVAKDAREQTNKTST